MLSLAVQANGGASPTLRIDCTRSATHNAIAYRVTGGRAGCGLVLTINRPAPQRDPHKSDTGQSPSPATPGPSLRLGGRPPLVRKAWSMLFRPLPLTTLIGRR
jgi:hypothetical protein